MTSRQLTRGLGAEVAFAHLDVHNVHTAFSQRLLLQVLALLHLSRSQCE